MLRQLCHRSVDGGTRLHAGGRELGRYRVRRESCSLAGGEHGVDGGDEGEGGGIDQLEFFLDPDGVGWRLAEVRLHAHTVTVGRRLRGALSGPRSVIVAWRPGGRYISRAVERELLGVVEVRTGEHVSGV